MSEVELQLCLALPTPNITKGFKFNLNNYHGFDHLKQMSCFGDKTNRVIKKRDFEHAFGNFSDDRNALPLLLWSGPPNEEDDDHNDRKKTTFAIDDVNEEDQVVEWPPIKSWRNRTCHHHRRCRRHHHKSAAGNGRSIYVKVKMEGVPIARKIDMRHYHSYQQLTNSLITMFTKNEKCDGDYNARYTLTYQDKEGDWLVAGDIPWHGFIRTVQRLKILSNWG
ncbi:hypothetical protein V6N11_062704 [Hibiscus sabdariffa]|uniref:Auxin-responsive protein n=1 Tax=Hibiscus sabdariffa TaxID=183260 RepID=A0ABR2PTB8_9ROSI